MLRKVIWVLMTFLVIVGLLAIATLQIVDRSHYQSTAYYLAMNERLDSLQKHLEMKPSKDQLMIGWSQVNITPTEAAPLAGYGARDAKAFDQIQDSIYVKTIIFQQGDKKVAVITADLLLIHPEVDHYIASNLPEHWTRDQLYFTASHSHSSIGGWAPGVVGELFAGSFDRRYVQEIGDHVISSILSAEQSVGTGAISFGELMIDDLVRNRLVKSQGEVDPWFKILSIQKDSLQGYLNFYSAHATTFDHHNNSVSGDYPALLNQKLLEDSMIHFSAFAAGAVGSMGPVKLGENPGANRQTIADKLVAQHRLFRLLGGAQIPQDVSLEIFRLNVAMPDPTFKIAENIAFRPWLFHWAFGDYNSEISVLTLGNTILIGLPVEFSGELAVPLYDYAKSLNLNLIITSFNGDYGGYVIKDDWYDLNKYESRTMSWQGPYAGAYFSETIRRILKILDENN
ncbi:MAG: neutral/alkaline non-lysosomal ceramidase N-terminal domain-containing protein [Cyclobacteriaceae bacterium]